MSLSYQQIAEISKSNKNDTKMRYMQKNK